MFYFNCNSTSTMSYRKKMGVHRAYFVMATVIVATSRGAGAVVVHAAVNLGGENGELLQSLFKQLDLLVNNEEVGSKALSQSDSELTATLLQAAPSVTVQGNITDTERRLTLTFTLHATRSPHSPVSMEEDDDEDDEWRSSGGVLMPIVGAVEPYVLGFVELVFNGILSSVISNFLEGSNLLGDVRLV